MATSVLSSSVFTRGSRQFFSGVLGLALFGFTASSAPIITPAEAQAPLDAQVLLAAQAPFEAQVPLGAQHGPVLAVMADQSLSTPASIEANAEASVVSEAAVIVDVLPVIEVPAVMPTEPVRIARNPQEAFIFSLISGAQESQRVTGVPASVTIAQGILESSWGDSRLSIEGHNYFGIKAHAKEGPAGVIWMQTWEVENGQDVMRQEPFRRYHDAAESLIDHGYFFVENPRYAAAMWVQDDPRQFAREINKAGYATDPAYAPKLISIMDRWDLYQYDLV